MKLGHLAIIPLVFTTLALSTQAFSGLLPATPVYENVMIMNDVSDTNPTYNPTLAVQVNDSTADCWDVTLNPINDQGNSTVVTAQYGSTFIDCTSAITSLNIVPQQYLGQYNSIYRPLTIKLPPPTAAHPNVVVVLSEQSAPVVSGNPPYANPLGDIAATVTQ